jgi:ARG/rhodanese/phosphatase superfamily protein
MLAFPEIRVADPISHESISIFPLEAEVVSKVDYALSDEALAAGTVTVEELGEAGSVPELIVNNQTDHLVLFLEGEELRGAKQNRVLNTSLLVAAQSKITIPVSCVEKGRWHYTSRLFASGGSHGSSKLRHILKQSVLQSVKEGRGHRSDQGEIWKEVDRQSQSLGSHSATGAMADTFETYKDRLAEYRDRLKYVEGATGLAVAVGTKVVSVDLFDKPSTCRKVWDRLLTGVIMDALEAATAEERVEKADTEKMLMTLRDSSWEQTKAVGVGDEYRCGWEDKHASALVYDGTVVHGSLVVAG